MSDHDIFQQLLVTERYIVDVSRNVERLRCYIANLESQGGDGSRARHELQSMRKALAALRRQRDQTMAAIHTMDSSAIGEARMPFDTPNEARV